MAIGNDILSASNASFWKLISKCIIVIPNYQREYAQGRDNRRAELIRNGFVNSLYDAISSSEKLELDFILGGKESDDEDDSFKPVDGQQRLTILFLLHWYIFMRANYQDKLIVLGKHFMYKTRTTSEVFCKKICESTWNFNYLLDENKKNRISQQIKNQPWFTGAMNSDPTVKSMLVVIDCIHERFYNLRDYISATNVLVSDKCPISFYCLDLNNALGITTGIRDLYIKMNARGVPLTDFELFKANLQRKDNSDSYFDLMAEYLGSKDTSVQRVELIGRFNNEYTNFFFKLIDDGKIANPFDNSGEIQKFDVSMMNFINEIFRMNYFCTISKLGISQKSYRADNDKFRKMSGKEFIDFIGTCGKPLNCRYWTPESITNELMSKIKASLTNSFRSIIELLDALSTAELKLDVENAKCCFSLVDIFKNLAVDPQNNRALPFRESLVRMALYEFILKYGIPSNEEELDAYNTWSRFIWKIDRNSDFKNFDEVVETLRGYKSIIASCKDCSFNSINKAIADCNNVKEKVFGAPAEMQLEEEIIKAKLIEKNENWKTVITQAENAFSDYGQIWFLLDLSKENDEYSYDKFTTALSISEQLFDASRNVIDTYSNAFERSLLAIKQYDKDDHLLSMGKYTTNTKRFVGRCFSAHTSHQYFVSSDSKENLRYKITLTLLNKMTEDKVTNDIEKWLSQYIEAGSSSVEWKDIFIKNDLLNKTIPGFQFKNGFEPDAWEENGYKYTAVYTNEMKRTYSGELHSFLMATKLVSQGISARYHTDSKEEYITEGFPNRFFTVNGNDFGYMLGEFYYRKENHIDKIGNENEAFQEIINMLS